MIPDIGERPVTADEWLARYILRREHVRADGTLKPDPFMPYKWVELSVTRHLGLEEPEIWQVGQTVADETRTTLQGRADAQAAAERPASGDGEQMTMKTQQTIPEPLPARDGWASMSSAPRDGSRFLAATEKGVQIARWSRNQRWRYESGSFCPRGTKLYPPLAWRHLPAWPNNLNHADVVDWPADKSAQKEIALMIAREASYQPKPVE